jgi:hypothetical protein
MSRRAARGGVASTDMDMSEVTNIDRLILAQAVFEKGASWTSVAKTLSGHKLLDHPKNFFTAKVRPFLNLWNAFVSPWDAVMSADIYLFDERRGPDHVSRGLHQSLVFFL